MTHADIAEANAERPTSGTDQILADEARALAQKRTDPGSPYYSGSGPRRADRRRFVLGSMAAFGVGSALTRHASAAAPLGAGPWPAR